MSNHFKENFQRYIDDLYSKNELKSLLEDIKDHSTDKDIDQLTKQLWDNLGDETAASHFETATCEKEAWKLLAKSKRTKQLTKVRRFIYYSISTAALVILMIKGINYYEKRAEKQIPIIAVTTGFGEHRTIILPDNTELSINSCTTVKYPERFAGNSRTIELSGEGYFKVRHNPSKPFIVKMENMSVTVLGTIFNVKSHPNDQTNLIEVKEGKVQVDLPEAMMRIGAGEHAIINKLSGSYSKEKDEVEKFAIWRTGGIRFSSTPIQDVAKELERIYNCQIKFSGNKPYDNLITGIHEGATLTDVLNSIEYATGIRYKYQNNIVTLYND